MITKAYHKLQTKEGITLVASIALIIFSVGAIVAAFGGHRMGRGMPGSNVPVPMIRVSGTGEIKATPDVATFAFSVSRDAATIAEARDQVAKTGNDLLTKLAAAGIEKKDIKTDSLSTYPKYENQSAGSTLCMSGMPCPQVSNPVIVGYTVSTGYTVTVRNLDNVSKIATILTDAKIFSLQGPNFAIDDPQKTQDEARALAIDDAKDQAQVLADQLGVQLGRIVDFQDDASGGAVPMPMYARAMDAGTAVEKSVAPELPTGESTVTSRVTITYIIK